MQLMFEMLRVVGSPKFIGVDLACRKRSDCTCPGVSNDVGCWAHKNMSFEGDFGGRVGFG
jgi:hypothetical protein